MYIHLGSDTVVRAKNIIGIFDIDYCSISKRTREFLRVAQDEGRVINVTEELPKSFVIVSEEAGDMVYVSGISPATLRKRALSRGGL
jgi:hypothetical protein